MLGKEEIYVLLYVFTMSILGIFLAWAGFIEIGQ